MSISHIRPSFNTPIKHVQPNNTTSTPSKKFADFIDDYFCWSNKCHLHKASNTKILNGKTVKVLTPAIYRRSAGRTVLKIVTYLTLIIPIIMLFAKIIYRSTIKNSYALEKTLHTKSADIDDNRPVITRCEQINNIIYIDCDLKALQWRPEEALRAIDNILKNNPHPFPNKLRIKFSEGQAIDEGGLGRTFISNLFNALMKKNTQIHCPEFDDRGMRMPQLNDSQIDNINDYQALGRLFVFLLHCRNIRPIDPNFPGDPPEPPELYPIGEIFSPVFFSYLIDDLDLDMIKTYPDKFLIPLFYRLLRLEEKGEEKDECGKQRNWIINHIYNVINVDEWENLGDDEKAAVQKAVTELNEIWYDDDLEDTIDENNFKEIQQAVGRNAKEPILNRLNAIKQIQIGMQSCLPRNLRINDDPRAQRISNITSFSVYHLQNALQGSLNIQELINRLIIDPVYNQRAPSIRDWLYEWILNPATTIEMLRKFVKAVTGSPALAENITIKASGHYSEVKTDTCHNALEVNNNLTKDQFLTALKEIIEDEKEIFTEY